MRQFELEEGGRRGLIFDAGVSANLDAILLNCRGGDDVPAMRVLRDALPSDARITRSAEGIRVRALCAPYLLSTNAGLKIQWTETAYRFVTNRARACRTYPIVRDALRDLTDSTATEIRQAVADSDGLDILDDHQVVNVAAMTINGGFGLCLFDEQGAGKTVSLIFAYDLLAARGEADQLLVIAPKSMVPEWRRDFLRFRPGLYRVAVVIGSREQKRTALRSQADVYVTNFETTVSFEHNLEVLLRSRPDKTVLAVDESFFVKAPEAQRTRAIRRLREWCGRAFVLCGTPAPNAPHDLVEQFNLVDFGIAFDGVTLPEEREQALPIVRQTVANRGLFVRNLKSIVLPELPGRTYHRIHVPLQPEQGRLYGELRDQLVADLQTVSDTEFRKEYSTFLARRAALLQVCSNPIAVVAGYEETPAKVVLLDDLLETRIEKDQEKVVLWSFYTASIDQLVRRYDHFGTVRYDGTIADTELRGEAVRRFQEDDDTRLFIANPAAAGAGLTLHRARLAIYESMSNQAAHYLQSLDRIHRRGQQRDVEYVVLLCEGTLEPREYERLLAKQRMAADLLGDDKSEPLTRESLLRDVTIPSDGNGEVIHAPRWGATL